MLDKLSAILKRTTDKIANAMFLDKDLIDSIVRDLQRALIEADVNIYLVKQLSDKIKKTAFDERIKGIEKKEHLIKVLHDELLSLLGEKKELTLKEKQNKIMLVGLYGSGKTTTIAKLGNYYAKRGKRVVLIGLDVHRPAAKEQLEQLGKQNNLAVFVDKKLNDPIKTYKSFEKDLKDYDLILIDTAGRDALSEDLIKELKELNKTITPTETILIMPADIGQAAKTQAQEFQKSAKITGVIITRMDSSAKGGGALTACSEVHSSVYFITTGEKINDLESFNPESFLSRLLGMGDLQTLIEKVHSVSDSKTQSKLKKNLEEGNFTLEDMIEQTKAMSGLGGFAKIKDLIPGLGKAKLPEEKIESQEAKVAMWEHIIKSMTSEEKNNPGLLEKQTSRIQRISKGSGTATSDIRSMLKQYKILKDFIKTGSGIGDMERGLDQKQMMKLAKKLGGKRFKI
ncbi:MAG: signal recognition particle receptor subunit alpha [Nanoarchaeota archaeon]